jgi:two-component system cell cycle response regulator
MLHIKFNLDNANRTEIKRQVLIQTIDDNYYEAIFYNPPPFDKDLGFYIIG